MNRKLWVLVNAIQSSALIPYKLRVMILRLAGVKIGNNSWIASGCFIGSNKLIIGDNVAINIYGFLDGCGCITIEDGVRVGPYVKILTGTHRIKNAKFRRDPSEELVVGDVLISKGTWIGMNVSILPNVVISSGCVVGASSLVIRNTEEDGLYCGVPAILIKKLPIN